MIVNERQVCLQPTFLIWQAYIETLFVCSVHPSGISGLGQSVSTELTNGHNLVIRAGCQW